MNQADLAKVLHDDYGFSKAESDRVLKTILDTIRQELKQNRQVRLRSFGTFATAKAAGKRRARFRDSKNFFR